MWNFRAQLHHRVEGTLGEEVRLEELELTREALSHPGLHAGLRVEGLGFRAPPHPQSMYSCNRQGHQQVSQSATPTLGPKTENLNPKIPNYNPKTKKKT